jgi:hypothetical protein
VYPRHVVEELTLLRREDFGPGTPGQSKQAPHFIPIERVELIELDAPPALEVHESAHARSRVVGVRRLDPALAGHEPPMPRPKPDAEANADAGYEQ